MIPAQINRLFIQLLPEGSLSEPPFLLWSLIVSSRLCVARLIRAWATQRRDETMSNNNRNGGSDKEPPSNGWMKIAP